MRLRERAKNRLKVPRALWEWGVEECHEVQTNEELHSEKDKKKYGGLGRADPRGEVTNVQYL
jgi:hypothetical protein